MEGRSSVSGGSGVAQVQPDPRNNFMLDCLICLAHIPVATSCGHIFCWPCMEEWLCTLQMCPLCSNRLGETDLTFMNRESADGPAGPYWRWRYDPEANVVISQQHATMDGPGHERCNNLRVSIWPTRELEIARDQRYAEMLRYLEPGDRGVQCIPFPGQRLPGIRPSVSEDEFRADLLQARGEAREPVRRSSNERAREPDDHAAGSSNFAPPPSRVPRN